MPGHAFNVSNGGPGGREPSVAIYDSTFGAVSGGYSPAQQQNAYYGRPATQFGPYARSQFNKCHAKD